MSAIHSSPVQSYPVHSYPVRVDAKLDAPLSRWLWLIKWVLVIPHYVVLAFLWLAFVVLSAVAFVAILFTGKYPPGIFEFNVGVLRWTWRVQYYAIGAFGTDEYPPFTLAEVPTYPAHLEVAYPERLSRGLALVKWWLLAIPHYIIIGLFTGGGSWFAWNAETHNSASWPGLIAVLALIAAVVLLVTGRYPRQIFDLVLGLNRWVLRVAAYAGLMTDEYPPFRLDMGGSDPASSLIVPRPGPQLPPPPRQDSQPPRDGWTPGRVVCVVTGALLAVCALGSLSVGATAWWVAAGRHDGYADLGSATYHSSGYAVTSSNVVMPEVSPGWDPIAAFVGTVRLRATSANGATPIFVGVGRTSDVRRYLAGVARETYSDFRGPVGVGTAHSGTAPAVPPATVGVWTESAAGRGTQAITWQVRHGDWTVVAMNADGSRPVTVKVNLEATLPALTWITVGLMIGGLIVLAGGVALIVVGARRTRPGTGMQPR